MADAIAKGTIDIIVKGQNDVNKVLKSTRRLKTELGKLKNLLKEPLTQEQMKSGRGLKGVTEEQLNLLRKTNRALNDQVREVVNGNKALGKSEALLVRQSNAFARLAANQSASGKNTALFTDAVQAQEKAEQKLRSAQIARFEAQRKLYEKPALATESFRNIEKLLTFSVGTNSISQLSAYRSELQRAFELVKVGSANYVKLKARIKEVTKAMEGPRGSGLKDLSRNLADAKREQEELVVGRAGTKEWVEATVRVKKAQFEYNKELAKSRIGTALINADINGSVRALNLAKQAAKGGLGILGGVAGAVGGAGKKALGTRFGQIGAARGIDALAKKVPVVDKAFGRLLQKIPLLGKFLNENISVNARWTAQILEGITGVTVAWNGLNQIISAAQAFTAFERQAAIAINSVARMFKEMYNVAGAMMMGLISPGQVGKNLWNQALDRPDVMAARRGPSRLEQRELDQAALKNKIKNAEVNEVQLIEGLNRQLLEVERAITEETRERILIRKKEQQSLMKGPVWTQYGSPAGPGSKGAGVLSNMEDKLGETRIRLAEKVTAEGKEYESVAKAVVRQETLINAELQEREAIYKRLQQGAPLTPRQQAEARTSLAAQRETEGIDFRGRTVSRRGFERYQRMRQGRRDRRQRFNENMMLGIGFPMLFGGGLGGIAGGAAGAVAQSKMGTKGGFGAQIILSALGQKFDQIIGQMIASTAKLGKAFSTVEPDIGAIVNALGETDTAYGKHISILEQIKGKEAAFEAVRERMISLVGQKGVKALTEFGDEVTKMASEFSKAMTQMSSAIARFLNKSGVGRAITRQLENANLFRQAQFSVEDGLASPEMMKLFEDKEKFGKARWQGGDLAKYNETLEKIRELQRKENTENPLLNTGAMADQKIQDQVKHLQRSLDLGTKRAEREQEIDEYFRSQGKNLENVTQKQRDDVAVQLEKRDALKEQLEMWTQIKDTIAGGLTNAIMGLIDGTKTLAESLAGILKQIAQILIQKALTSWIGGLKFGGGGVASGGTSAMVAADNAMYGNTFPAGSFSKGGLVTRPTIGLIGEAGEDEYIIPSSKMQGAMERYSAGARGQGVIPGSGTVASGSGVSSAPTTVNYTGPVLSFNSEAYVPKSAIPEIINSAARRGAQEGQSKVMSQLKNSRSQRSRIGL